MWTGLYLRGIINQVPQEEAWQEIYKIREYDKELRSKVSKLRRQLASLEREAVAHGVVTSSQVDGTIKATAGNS